MPESGAPCHFHAHGKLLLTGEYLVLDGAKALALPTRLGQSLNFSSSEKPGLHWFSFDQFGALWFQAEYELDSFKISSTTAPPVANTLQQLLLAARSQNRSFVSTDSGIRVETHLQFDRTWGLGSSSTLIANLAAWAQVDPFLLLEETMGGSGYDLACAQANGPIIYWKEQGKAKWKKAGFNPPFRNQLYFVYLGKKQDSRKGIAQYQQRKLSGQREIQQITRLTGLVEKCQNLSTFEALLEEHENRIAQLIGLEKPKVLYFSDYWGSIKSLGAWGGDFVLATSTQTEAETKKYFNDMGFSVVINYDQLIL